MMNTCEHLQNKEKSMALVKSGIRCLNPPSERTREVTVDNISVVRLFSEVVVCV